jgi:hypothetical protein
MGLFSFVLLVAGRLLAGMVASGSLHHHCVMSQLIKPSPLFLLIPVLGGRGGNMVLPKRVPLLRFFSAATAFFALGLFVRGALRLSRRDSVSPVMGNLESL